MLRRVVALVPILAVFACRDSSGVLPTAPNVSAVGGPVMLIAEAGSSTAVNAQSGASTLVIPAPGGLVAGDFLLAQITFEKGADINNLQGPTGGAWTLVRRTNSIDVTTGTDLGQAIFYRVATAGEPADYTWTFLQGTSLQQVRAAGGITRYTGVNTLHPAGPIVGSSGGAGDGIVLTAPTVTGIADAVLVALFGHKKLTTLTDPAGMTNLYAQTHSNQSGPTIRASREVLTANAATGPRVSAADPIVGGDKWIAQLVALRSNTKPVYTAPAGQASDEGEDKAFALGSFVDPDAHPSWSITVNWGDGSSETFSYLNPMPADPFAARSLGTRNHTYTDNNPGNAPYTVTVTVNDGTDSHSGTFEVTVNNVAPTVTSAANQSADEGEDKAFDLGSFSDPGVNDTPWAVNVDWGDNSTDTDFNAAAQGALGTQNHTYADNRTYQVTVTVTDKDGAATVAATFDVVVANVPPTADWLVTPTENVPTGDPVDLSLTNPVDPSSADVAAGFHYAFSCNASTNDLTTATYLNNSGPTNTAQCTFASPGSYTVLGRIIDKDDGYTEYSQVVEVIESNTPPVVTAPANQTSDEAENKSFTLGSFTDASDAGPWDVVVDWGDGSTDTQFSALAAGSLGNRSHTYADNQPGNAPYTVTVTVTDQGLLSDFKQFTVTVANLPPTATLGNNGPKFINEAVTVTFTVPTDPSSVDQLAGFTYAFDCGNDGTFEVGPAASASTTCTFTTPGSKTIAGRIFDKDGGNTTYTTNVQIGFQLYLHDNPTPPTSNQPSETNLPFNFTAPTATVLLNYATNYDNNTGVTGRFMDKTSSGTAEPDSQKFQTWRTVALAAGSELTVGGNLQVRIWAKMKAPNKTIQLRGFLRECTSTTEASCTTFATLDMTAVSNASNTAFTEYTLSAAAVTNRLIDATNRLQLRIVVLDVSNADPLYLAYDTQSFLARLIVP